MHGEGCVFYMLSPHKQLSTDLSGFHHPSLIQGCSKRVLKTHHKSGRLAGTWKVFKGNGGWEHRSRDGLVSEACGGGSTSPRLRHLHRVFVFELSGFRIIE